MNMSGFEVVILITLLSILLYAPLFLSKNEPKK